MNREQERRVQHGAFAYVAFALGHIKTTAEGSDIRIEGLRALNEIGAILLDVKSVCETLPGKIAAGNTEGALLEIEWLAGRLAPAALPRTGIRTTE